MKAYPTRELPMIPDPKPNVAREPRRDFPGMKSSDRAPHEVIMHLAYAIWEREGHPHDRQLANWLEAEAEVMARN